jgi:hypothetical protein
LHTVKYEVCWYPQYRPMSLWRLELKLGSETPVGWNVAWVHPKNPRDSFLCPLPDGCSSLAFCQPMSECMQRVQRSDPASRIACRRSLVGMMSCTTTYQFDLVSSGTQAVCRFFHTCLQFVTGLSRVILISGASFAALAIICSVPYTFGLNVRSVALLPGGVIYAMSSV